MRSRCTYSMRYFFFSSRRRHTRCSRDWSSDVCSSDLCLQTLEADRGSTLIRELVLDLKSHHERRQQYCQGTPSARSPFHRAPHRTKTDPYAHPTLRRVPAPATCMRSCQRCCPGWSAIRRTSLLASPKG